MTSRLRLALIASLLAVPSVASAHIQLVKPTPRVVDPMGIKQKAEHCGSAGYSRAANPDKTTYFKPGETIRLMWNETIGHKGWYRIAFLQNGETFHVPPPGNGVDFNDAPANYPTLDMTGMTDPATGTLVLKDRIVDPVGLQAGVLMADVTLPNVECTNCTLQLTQFMLDPGATSYNIDRIYFNCADIVLSNSAPPPPPANPDAGPVDPTPEPTEPVDGDLKGTCSTGQAGGFGAALLVGLLALVRRRSSRRA
jgi:MYXO-CTERM domain-containing protein